MQEKIDFVRKLPISFLELARLFVKDRRRKEYRYIIDTMPMSLAKYPLDMRPNQNQWRNILDEFKIKHLFGWELNCLSKSRKYRTIDDEGCYGKQDV